MCILTKRTTFLSDSTVKKVFLLSKILVEMVGFLILSLDGDCSVANKSEN